MASPVSRHGPSPARAPTGLLDLPNELLQAIASWLIPDPPATTRFALRPAGTWGFKGADVQWAEWEGLHRDLRALARTNRRFADIASACRYHTVVVHSGAGLVRLFRHLVEKPAARGCIHSLSCLVSLLDPEVINDARREWALQLRRGFRIPPGLLSQPPAGAAGAPRPAPTPSPDNSIAIALFNFVVGYADKLADLLLAHPDQSQPMLNVSLINFIFTAPGLATSKVPAPSHELQFFPTLASLQRLTSLRLYCNREGVDREDSFTQAFAKYVVTTLPKLPQLTTLELCCDSPHTWDPLLDAAGYPSLPGIRHMRLYGSRIREPELVALCQACVNLETLVVHFEDPCHDDFDRPRLPGGKTLNDALLGLAGSLRRLELVALSEGHYLTRGRERPRKPENHRLTCFAQLRHLQHLTVDYRGLFGTMGTFEYEDGESLKGLLPNSLRSFTLVCEWGGGKDYKQRYLADLEMMLDGVEQLCSTGRQELSNVSLAVHSWPETSKYRTKFRRNMERVKATCAMNGVRFKTFELFPQYRDEDEASNLDGEEEDDDEDGASDDDEIEEEQEDSEYYFSGDDEADLERDARRPATFEEFVRLLGEDHGHAVDELYYAYYEDRWDEYLF